MTIPSLSWHTINIQKQEEDNKYPEILTAKKNTGKWQQVRKTPQILPGGMGSLSLTFFKLRFIFLIEKSPMWQRR